MMKTSENKCLFYATAGRGTEKFLVEEIKAISQNSNVTYTDGKVYWEVSDVCNALPHLMTLKCAERLFVAVLKDENFRLNGKKSLYKLFELVKQAKSKFVDSLEVYKLLHSHQEQSDSPSPKKMKIDSGQDLSSNFRISCKCTARQKLTPQDMSRTIGASLVKNLGWKVNLKNPALEITVQMNDNGLLIGFGLSKQPLTQRAYLRHTGLRSSVAWIMARLADVQPGDVVLDPMCGCSTILVEAAKSWPQGQFVGVDSDAIQITKARENITIAKTSNVHLFIGDATALPLKDGTINAAVCDLPFGFQHLTKKEVRSLYPAVVKELERVLLPAGVAVLLTSEDLVSFLLECTTCSEQTFGENEKKKTDEPSKSEESQLTGSKEAISADHMRFSNNSRIWNLKAKHYIKLGETHSYICIFMKCS